MSEKASKTHKKIKERRKQCLYKNNRKIAILNVRDLLLSSLLEESENMIFHQIFTFFLKSNELFFE
ncbi:hypothetical protein V4S31_02930 [Enterococcus cecorum]|uniref:hypothetical protein n=1 Tax=Enterococcus cecorum TaxID=44008 RepID=UPI0013A609B8|nr:hypothetical protein [Enterococcus cecorum]